MQIASTGFRVVRWAAWTPEFDTGEVAGVPQTLKRRISKTGQKALAAAWSLDAKEARIIFSSRHGDFSRTISLMKSLAESGEVSPADFTLSVHHGLVGLLSIALVNRRGHTAISSGTESFCYGFLEAIACLKAKPDEQVLLIHCDEPLPEPFACFNEPDEQPLALALLLDNGNDYSFSATSPLPSGGDGGGKKSPPATSLTPTLSRKEREKYTAVPGLDFLNLLRGGEKEKSSNCETALWHWKRNV